jgi:hypothetical protein
MFNNATGYKSIRLLIISIFLGIYEECTDKLSLHLYFRWLKIETINNCQLIFEHENC